jgi:hypothetical protein
VEILEAQVLLAVMFHQAVAQVGQMRPNNLFQEFLGQQ